MKSHYRPIGDFVRQVNARNTDMAITNLQGISINKHFMPSVANINGTDLGRYKLVNSEQFAFNPMHVGRDEVLPIAMLESANPVIVSPAYVVFEIVDKQALLPEYLMMWCRRPEFDRNAWFTTDSSVRGGFSWNDFCNLRLPVPSIDQQQKIVTEYQVIVDRIKLNEQLSQKLEETAQAIFKHWFVDFEFPMSAEYAASIGRPDLKGKPYKSNGGEMVYNDNFEQEFPVGWYDIKIKKIASKIGSGSTPKGGKGTYQNNGISLIRSQNVLDYRFHNCNLAYINQEQADNLNNVIVQENDILLNITGVSVARCCIAPKDVLPARVNQHVMIIRPKIEYPINCYLLCLLCSTPYKMILIGTSDAGSTRQALNKHEIESLNIIMPKNEILKKFECIITFLFNLSRNLYMQSSLQLELQNNLLSMVTVARETSG